MLGQRLSGQDLASKPWDVVVIGGGITGAGILLEAARRGLTALLLEHQDFSWGTSSRSSKMVHGGLRYMAQGDLQLTRHSLQERERLLAELPDLVVRMSYLFPIRKGKFPGRFAMQLVLAAYDKLAGINDHQWLNRHQVLQLYPHLQGDGLKGAMRYTDALTDDSRLVIRVLQEACLEGGIARNYMAVERIVPGSQGSTLQVVDQVSGQLMEIKARQVFNATGLWADRLSGTAPKVRPQRGSHLFIEHARLPLTDCLTILHPDDQRPVFVFPWKGQTCIGTTDLDHQFNITHEAFCTTAEVQYLLKAANAEFKQLALVPEDIISTMAGVRPIIASGRGRDPSRERRDHLVWQANGIISVSGGKLTTFRQIAIDALHAAGLIDDKHYPMAHAGKQSRCFNHQLNTPVALNHPLHPVAQGAALQHQVEWILQHEMVQHLDDLMLRRLRAGNLQPHGAMALLPHIKPLCQHWLGWDEERWQHELKRYLQIVQQYYQSGAHQAGSSEAGINGLASG